MKKRNKSRYPKALRNPLLVAANPQGYQDAMLALDLAADFPFPTHITLLGDGTIQMRWVRRPCRVVEVDLDRKGEMAVRGICPQSQADGFPELHPNIHLTLRNLLAWLMSPLPHP